MAYDKFSCRVCNNSFIIKLKLLNYFEDEYIKDDTWCVKCDDATLAYGNYCATCTNSICEV